LAFSRLFDNDGKQRLPRILEAALALLLLIELIAPAVTSSYGVDGRLHIAFLREFTNLVSNGVWIPRWVPEGFYGFGSAIFYFYPPLTFYVASIVRLVTGFDDPKVLYQITSVLATIASIFTARALIREIGSTRYQSMLGGLLYAFGPFRLAELYGRSALPTHVAYVFLPLVWLFLIRVVRNTGTRWLNVIGLASCSALLCLTNLPLALVMAVCIVIVAIFLRRSLSARAVVDVAVGGILAFALSAYHYFAALSVQRFVHLEDLDVGDPPFIVKQLPHLVNLQAGYYIGLVYLAALILLYPYWKKRAELTASERNVLLAGLGILLFTIYLETPYLSLLIWRNVNIFKIIQFGWRFYPQVVLATAVAIGIASSLPMRRASVAATWTWVIGSFPPAIMVLFSLHLGGHLDRPPEDAAEYRPIAFYPNQYNFADPQNPSPTRLGGGDLLDTIAHVLSPHRNDPYLLTQSNLADSFTWIVNTPYRKEIGMNIGDAHLVTIHQFYWPAGHLYSDNIEITTRPDTLGRATTNLPAGDHKLRWQLERTSLERAGLWISAIAWIGMLASTGIGLIRKRVRRQRATTIA